MSTTRHRRRNHGGLNLKVSSDARDLARTSDPERNVMGQSTEMSSLVSMLFWTFLNPLKF